MFVTANGSTFTFPNCGRFLTQSQTQLSYPSFEAACQLDKTRRDGGNAARRCEKSAGVVPIFESESGAGEAGFTRVMMETILTQNNPRRQAL